MEITYIFIRCVVGGPSPGGGSGQPMMANGGVPGKASSGGGGKDFRYFHHL